MTEPPTSTTDSHLTGKAPMAGPKPRAILKGATDKLECTRPVASRKVEIGRGRFWGGSDYEVMGH